MHIDLPDGCGQWRGIRRSGLGAVLLVILVSSAEWVHPATRPGEPERDESGPIKRRRYRSHDALRTDDGIRFLSRTLPIWYWI